MGSIQHIPYWLDDSDYDAAAEQMESAGYPAIQGFKLPPARVGYYDTRPAIGVVTEIVGATKEGHEFRANLKKGSF